MHAETEEEIIDALDSGGYWEDEKAWKLFGDMQNNFSTIGNQQGESVAALVEKLINSIDARLTGECLAHGIDPSDPNSAPQTSREAVQQFFGKPFEDWSDSEILSEARKITLTASGKSRSGNPSISITDQGEGQTPDDFEETFLSLNSSNKLNIPFVQGKFNMGGTGAFQFCGTTQNFQLIVSRRRPDILGSTATPRDRQWGFTIIRRRDPEGTMRSSVYEYLAPRGKVLGFDAGTLPILPSEGRAEQDRAIPYGTAASWGALIKLYSYQLEGDRSSIVGRTGLARRVEAMLPRATLPIRFVETRVATHGGMNAFGVENRLEREATKVLERGFPTHGEISVSGVRLKVAVYAFQPNMIRTYRPNARSAIVFLINGQTHASFGTQFFRRNSIRKGYVAEDLFVTVDCTPLSGRDREDLFLNSRDRMRDGHLKEMIESELAEFLREHKELGHLNQMRSEALLKKRLEEQDAVNDQIVSRLLRDDQELRKLLLEGGKIGTAKRHPDDEESPELRRFPTLFELRKPRPMEGVATVTVARGSRVLLEFETDAENDYFARKSEPGRWSVTDGLTGEDLTNEFGHRGPSEGRWFCWSSTLSSRAELNEEIWLLFAIEDDDLAHLDVFGAEVKVQIKAKPETPNPKPPPSPNGRFRLPRVEPVWQDSKEGYLSWSDMRTQGIEFGPETVVEVREADNGIGSNTFDIFVNMDNTMLVRRRRKSRADISAIDALWRNANVLLALSMLADQARHEQDEDGRQGPTDSPTQFVRRSSRAIAPVVASLHDFLSWLNASPETNSG